MPQQPYRVDAQGNLLVDAQGQPMVRAQDLNTWATFNGRPIDVMGEPQTPPTDLGGAFSAFGTGLRETMDPTPIVTGLADSARSRYLETGSAPMAGVMAALDLLRNIGSAQGAMFDKSREAFNQGRVSEGLGYGAAYLMPMVGPAAAAAGETIGRGEISRGLGQATGILAPFGSEAVGARLRSAAAERGASLARRGEERFAREQSPSTGREKLRFATDAKKAASWATREPGITGWTIDQVDQALQSAHAEAARGLDQVYAPIPKTKPYATAPIKAGLRAQIRKLSPRGMGANAGAVEPFNRAARIAALKKALQEVNKLGNLVNIDNLRDLITAWQSGGEKAYTPSVVADAFTARGEGMGWADAGSIGREYLVTREPQTAVANAKYTLAEAARDAITAAKEAEFVRPRTGRRMFKYGMAAGAGSLIDGGMGAGIGIAIAEVWERAREAGVTTQFKTARGLVAVGDAMRAGNVQAALEALQRLGEPLGVAVTGTARFAGGPVRQPTSTTTPTMGPR